MAFEVQNRHVLSLFKISLANFGFFISKCNFPKTTHSLTFLLAINFKYWWEKTFDVVVVVVVEAYLYTPEAKILEAACLELAV